MADEQPPLPDSSNSASAVPSSPPMRSVGTTRFHFQLPFSPHSSSPRAGPDHSVDAASLVDTESFGGDAAQPPLSPSHFRSAVSPTSRAVGTVSRYHAAAFLSPHADTAPPSPLLATPSAGEVSSRATSSHFAELLTPRLHTKDSFGERELRAGESDTALTSSESIGETDASLTVSDDPRDGQLTAREIAELSEQLRGAAPPKKTEGEKRGKEGEADSLTITTIPTVLSSRVSKSSMRSALAAEAKLLSLPDDTAANRTVDNLLYHLWKLEAGSDGTVRECGSQLDDDSFTRLVSTWNVPSQHVTTEELDAAARVYESNLPIGRRLLAHWSVEGPMSSFVMLVVALQIAMGLYYFIEIAKDPRRHVLGWGIAFAKLGAGVLYPTLALLLLSSSRRLATYLRQWHFVSRFVDWDRSQKFHVCMAITVLVFALLHALSHLIGDFRQAVGSDSPLLPNFPHPITYRAMLATRAGVTGIIALAILLLICATSMPKVRRSNFQLFQYTHLLIWPFIGLLLAHGTGDLIARPVLGYWLIIPLLAVLWDRIPRLVNAFRVRRGCEFRVVQDRTIVLSIPRSAVRWSYKPGQYILIRVAAVSWGQWHPFTVVGVTSTTPSGGEGGESEVVAELWIRQLGDWTTQLAKSVESGQKLVVNLDGPFGSPADKLTKYQRIVIVGTGIGVTPYAGWLQDVRAQQRVDFHWVVRDSASFSWFSALLNSLPLRWERHVADNGAVTAPRGQINLRTYATGLPPRSTLQYVCRVLLEKHRTITHPQSFITGLECETTYGRPNLARIFSFAQQMPRIAPPQGDGAAVKGGMQDTAAEAPSDGTDKSFQRPSAIFEVVDRTEQEPSSDTASSRHSVSSSHRAAKRDQASKQPPTATSPRAAAGGVVSGGSSSGGGGRSADAAVVPRARVGVFFCGPNYLGMEISDRCRMESLKGDTRFDFVGEVF